MQVIEHYVPPRDEPPVRSLRAGLEAWLHRPGTARVILLGSLVVTALAWWGARHFAIDDARQRFERRADDIHGRIERRMASYEQMLRAGVAMLVAEGAPSRLSWRRYVETVQPELHYPGIQGFGVSRLIRPDELAAHESAIRAEGFPAYAVKPPGPRDEYTSIIYLEPFARRNLRAFGYDMFSEPTRHAAMQRARESGRPAMSGIVTLVQEDGKDVQRGLLVYAPVYAVDGRLTGGPAAPEQLWGWVYAPFRVRDLMTGILGTDTGNIAFRLFDTSGEPGEPFYESDNSKADDRAIGFSVRREFRFAERSWQIDYSGQDFADTTDTWASNLVAVCGLMIDLLLYWSIASLARRKRQIEREVALRGEQAQARLAWLTSVSGLSLDAILVFERDSGGQPRLVFTNPAFSQWFGLHPHELLGLSETAVDEWLERLAGDAGTMPPLAAGDAQVVVGGPPMRVLKRRMREDARQRVYYFRDITHESEIERMKNEFLSTAAHELRTPLASVYGFSELLLDGRIDAAKRARATQIVHRQAATLKHLVDALLDLARLDSRHGRDFVFQPVDLRQIAETAAESTLAAGQKPRVQLEVPPAPVWVQADAARVQQAIVNVLSNALKYSKPASTVSLTVLPRAMRNGREVAGVRVVDSGIGMSPEHCARAFERFYRADPSGHVLGAGLGLAIVKEIIELHRGSVELHSTPGAGTQVTIWLPPAEVPSDAVPLEAALA